MGNIKKVEETKDRRLVDYYFVSISTLKSTTKSF